ERQQGNECGLTVQDEKPERGKGSGRCHEQTSIRKNGAERSPRQPDACRVTHAQYGCPHKRSSAVRKASQRSEEEDHMWWIDDQIPFRCGVGHQTRLEVVQSFRVVEERPRRLT